MTFQLILLGLAATSSITGSCLSTGGRMGRARRDGPRLQKEAEHSGRVRDMGTLTKLGHLKHL